MKTKALAVVRPNQIECIEVELPTLNKGQVLVETAYSCVSPGTELRCLSGEGEASTFPYIPGYAMAGRIIACGSKTSTAEGTPVFTSGTKHCSIATQWGAHIAHVVTSESDLIKIPKGVSLQEAALAKIAAIPYHGARLTPSLEGKKVAVVGLGPIGQLSARIHHALGAEVVGGDLLDARVKLLQASGAKAVNTGSGIQEAFKDTLPEGADIVVDAAGVPQLIPHLIQLAKDKPWNDTAIEGARFIIQASYSQEINIPYAQAFMKELSLYLPRDSQPSDVKAVMNLIAEKKLQIEDIASATYPPEDVKKAFKALQTPKKIAGTILFKWK